jgi:hypothetical protein
MRHTLKAATIAFRLGTSAEKSTTASGDTDARSPSHSDVPIHSSTIRFGTEGY